MRRSKVRWSSLVSFILALGSGVLAQAPTPEAEPPPAPPVEVAPTPETEAQPAPSAEPAPAPETEPTPAPPVEPAGTAPPAPAMPTVPAATTVPTVEAPLTFHAGEATLVLELQARTRGEVRTHPYVGPFAATDLHFVTARFRVGARADWRFVRIRVQAQEARDFGVTAPGTEAGSFFGVHQGYGELFRGGSFLRVGRQEVTYGDERLVGPLDWASAARSFDAIRAHHVIGDLSFDALGAILTSQQRLAAGTPPTPDTRTGGDYFAAAQLGYAPLAAFHGELLYLYRRDRATAALPTNDRRISAFSARATGTIGTHFRYAAEGVFEMGQVQRLDFLAYAAFADVFALFPSKNPTSAGVGFALGSGERSGRIGEFENFFPTNHKFYGYADLFGLRNLIEGHAVVSQQLASRKANVQLQGYGFFLEQTTGRWTNAGGAQIAAANPANTDRFVGFEIDATGSYRVNDLFSVAGGYSLFVPGPAAETLLTSSLDPQHWVFAQLDFRSN